MVEMMPPAAASAERWRSLFLPRPTGISYPKSFRGLGSAINVGSNPVTKLALSGCIGRSVYERLPGTSRDRMVTCSPMAVSAVSASFTEMNDPSDFEAIASPDGYLSICGFGSLLSERSARGTFPHLKNFRVAVLRGFRRVFGHVAPIFFERGIARPETGEISSLSVEPCHVETLMVTVFEISKLEIKSFIEREHEFRFLAVVPEDFDGKPSASAAVLCSRYSDEEYFRIRCKGDEKVLFERYGRHNVQKIWRDDILPCRIYLRHCVLAAKNLGQETCDNFLDHTYLGDRKTTIRQYLASTGSGIMEEEPPEDLRNRYGG